MVLFIFNNNLVLFVRSTKMSVLCHTNIAQYLYDLGYLYLKAVNKGDWWIYFKVLIILAPNSDIFYSYVENKASQNKAYLSSINVWG